MMRACWLVAASVLLAVPANADDAATHAVAIGGTGRDACSAWTADRTATSQSAQQASQRRVEWVSGFFSAANMFTTSSGSLHGGIDDQDGMLGWIDDYCRKHPGDPLFAASMDLFLDLRNHPRK